MEPLSAATTAAETFCVFALLHMETQTVLYKTCARVEEILQANANLRAKQLPYRYVDLATFSMPSLHDPLQ
jgi:hypothetical protein